MLMKIRLNLKDEPCVLTLFEPEGWGVKYSPFRRFVVTHKRLHLLYWHFDTSWLFLNMKTKMLGKIWIKMFYLNTHLRGVLKNEMFETWFINIWALYRKNWASYVNCCRSRFEKISLSQTFQISRSPWFF